MEIEDLGLWSATGDQTRRRLHDLLVGCPNAPKDKDQLEELIRGVLLTATVQDVRVGQLRRPFAPLAKGMAAVSGHGDQVRVIAVGMDDRRESSPTKRPAVPSVVGDLAGHECRPDPMTATTEEEFVAVMRRYWEWAGEPSSRILSKRSEGAFSHTTIAGLLAENPGKRPAVRLDYVKGFIKACGGCAEEICRWVTAWRVVYKGFKVPTTTPLTQTTGDEPPDQLIQVAAQPVAHTG